MPAGVTLLDFAAAAHFLHGKDSSSQFLDGMLREKPDWLFSHNWVGTYKSWSYTT